MMKMTSRVRILPLTLLVLISETLALSPVISPTRSPAAAPPKHTPVSPQPLPPALPPTSLPPSPASHGPDCTNSLLNLTSCLTYVEQGGNLTVPEKGCCPALAGLVDSNPICLCQLLASSNTFGIKIDVTKALMLPTICHVQTPPVSLCNELGIPVSSPGPLSPAGGATEPSGVAPSAPPSNSAAPSAAGDGITTARVTVLQLALLAIISQVIVFFF